MPDLRHDLELSETRRKKLKKDLVKLEKRLDETPKFIPIYDPVLREKDRRYQQGKVHSHAQIRLRKFWTSNRVQLEIFKDLEASKMTS